MLNTLGLLLCQQEELSILTGVRNEGVSSSEDITIEQETFIWTKNDMLKICLARMRTDICRQVAREENFVVIFSHLIARLSYGRLRERELKKKICLSFDHMFLVTRTWALSLSELRFQPIDSD